jgi:hypothetical protein
MFLIQSQYCRILVSLIHDIILHCITSYHVCLVLFLSCLLGMCIITNVVNLLYNNITTYCESPMSSISYTLLWHSIWIMWVLNPRNLFRKQMPYLWTNDPYSYCTCGLYIIDVRETGIEPVKTLLPPPEVGITILYYLLLLL